MVQVFRVIPSSAADRAGILAGDVLIAINGHAINDVLDYRFYLVEKKLALTVHRGEELFDVSIVKRDPYDDIGLEFETYLMDRKRECRNRCIFCFIDQLPPGLRDTLYFKDDDSRLSFLMGNYITLTNLSEADVDRIIAMRTSPVNVSIHTTDPALRVAMLRNKNAGDSLGCLKRFADAGLDINGQIVLCRGVNDGEALDRTMRDLMALGPHMVSVSVVPAGLTRYRDKLYPLAPFSREECAAVIRKVEAFSDECLEKTGSRRFFLGDEWYIKAGLPLHDEAWYEGYPQLENGVGLIPSLSAEFDAEAAFLSDYDLKKERHCAIATGEAAYPFILSLVERLKAASPAFDCAVYPIRNDFFGPEITVAGLLTGRDLLSQLKDRPLGDCLYLPAVTLRSDGDLFLDGMSHEELARALNTRIRFIENDGAAFIAALLD